MKQYTGVGERTAAMFLTGHLVALTLGRIVSTWLMRWFQPSRMMGTYAVINVLLVLIGVLDPGTVGGSAILVTSFFMSIMYPTIFALGLKGLGPNTKLGGSLIVMSLAGGGIMPPMLGYIARQTGSYASGYLVPLSGSAVVALYAFFGSPTSSAERA
jgi:FHS family L-fucose permease-like MFS transporter